ncbi:MAG: YjiG family protein [Negativicoccus succinicivorans]|uniref:Nucleoside recognition protein n=1 Tax=Negativicoccus succinicivorans DORA_17_25 TaxID=1403945 RepID=W1U554_9FIRM|nr:YjiG family protein [Negativicoccus succinicivorans]ETI88932.1 MAG: Nucleoside recognition protein [Negativicoccus succinicivorans DORA_17_25]MBS5889925.1 YjiG family protein [Negativicoccus succinicivorans]MBS5917397.1 YjiG family protein [Negativicoccus succinicivorans]MDU0986493.1 YjiG family protein [Negativicoccus succinicivorans]MDU1066199.1 YjiG family protein [Negativicoccus succinicivorans]
MNNKDTQSKNPFDVFVIGARKGWNIAVNNMIPNVLMAFAIAHILDLLGVLNFMSVIFGPVMGIFGLPGQAVMALLTAWLSLSAGVGMAVSLAGQGLLNGTHLTILLPAMVLMGSQLQYMGRLLAVADVKKKYWPLLMLTSILNAVIAMFIMRILA